MRRLPVGVKNYILQSSSQTTYSELPHFSADVVDMKEQMGRNETLMVAGIQPRLDENEAKALYSIIVEQVLKLGYVGFTSNTGLSGLSSQIGIYAFLNGLSYEGSASADDEDYGSDEDDDHSAFFKARYASTENEKKKSLGHEERKKMDDEATEREKWKPIDIFPLKSKIKKGKFYAGVLAFMSPIEAEAALCYFASYHESLAIPYYTDNKSRQSLFVFFQAQESFEITEKLRFKTTYKLQVQEDQDTKYRALSMDEVKSTTAYLTFKNKQAFKREEVGRAKASALTHIPTGDLSGLRVLLGTYSQRISEMPLIAAASITLQGATTDREAVVAICLFLYQMDHPDAVILDDLELDDYYMRLRSRIESFKDKGGNWAYIGFEYDLRALTSWLTTRHLTTSLEHSDTIRAAIEWGNGMPTIRTRRLLKMLIPGQAREFSDVALSLRMKRFNSSDYLKEYHPLASILFDTVTTSEFRSKYIVGTTSGLTIDHDEPREVSETTSASGSSDEIDEKREGYLAPRLPSLFDFNS